MLIATASSGDTVFDNAGDDRFFAQTGGDNHLTGNVGADQFWIAAAERPEAANTVKDFTSGEDVLAIAGLGTSFDTLNISQVAEDTSISFGTHENGSGVI